MDSLDEVSGAAPEQFLRKARSLLVEALDLMDRAEAPGHLGARLQHVIDDLPASPPERIGVSDLLAD